MQTNFTNNIFDFNKLADVSQYDKLGNSAVSAAKELVDINSRAVGKFLGFQMNMARLYVEGGEKQMDAARGIASLDDYMATQTELWQEYVAGLTEAAESNIQLAQNTGDEYQSWFTKHLKTAEEMTSKPGKAKKAKTKPAVKAAKV